ncbi:urease accessory protein [Vibrio xiamenensis]|uniref:Urease accessory protein n=1 Tax=Vibrio xiamenensis TaxID=861298 RepID=A0A1G8AMX9_9VIBR|nr:HupE/UreJ family protein [Vibrio xiamenensis]SDH22345.1 urease accessory protein [Vibrio xiamenensis]
MVIGTRQWVLAGAVTLLSAPCFAHVGHLGEHGMQASFTTGFLHPLTGLDHLTALILIGIFAASYSSRKAAQIIGCFALALIGGFFVGVEWSSAHQVEGLVTVSLVILPIAVYALRKGGAMRWVAMLAIAAFSACHGLVQGAEAIGAVSEFGFGSLTASVLVMTATMLIARWIKSASRELHCAKRRRN